jgi:TolB-like protein
MRRGLFMALLVIAGCSSAGNSQVPAPAPAPAGGASGSVQSGGGGAQAVSAQSQSQFDSRPAIAVLPFQNGGSFGPNSQDYDAFEVGAQQMMLTELAQNPALRIVERSVLRELIEEQNLATSGRVDPQTAARIGKLVGARYIITGTFADNFGDFRMDARIVDVETSVVVKAEQVRNRRENLYDVLVDLAGKMTAGVNLPPLAANVRNQRMDREIPPEALTLYSRAQVAADGGRTDRAIELYRSIVQQFPEMTEAQEALKQLGA